MHFFHLSANNPVWWIKKDTKLLLCCLGCGLLLQTIISHFTHARWKYHLFCFSINKCFWRWRWIHWFLCVCCKKVLICGVKIIIVTFAETAENIMHTRTYHVDTWDQTRTARTWRNWSNLFLSQSAKKTAINFPFQILRELSEGIHWY